MSIPVTILWVGVDRAETPARYRELADFVDAASLSSAIVIAMARGGVVTAVRTDEDEHKALALGADEVLVHPLDADTLARAVDRARLRATARAQRDARLADELFRADGEAIELLSAAVAHELKTPLAIASLNSEVLRESLGLVTTIADQLIRLSERADGPVSPEMQRLITLRAATPLTSDLMASADDIASALRRATHVVKKMAALTFPDQNDDSTDLSEALWKVETLMRGLMERSARFTVDVPSTPCLVTFPRWQLMQSIAALLANSFEAINAKKSEERGEIRLRLTVQRWVAVIEIQDTGVGMTPELRSRALNPFFTTRRPGALGLGLTIAAARVRRGGGEVLVESEPGVGTRIRVFLPTVATVSDADVASGGAFDN